MNRLMRSRTDRKIAGVCGGLARENGWDSTVVRLVWVAFVLFAGTGVLAYLAMWILVPEEPLAMTQQPMYAPVYPGTQPYAAPAAPPETQYPGHGPTTGA